MSAAAAQQSKGFRPGDSEEGEVRRSVHTDTSKEGNGALGVAVGAAGHGWLEISPELDPRH